MKKALLYFLLIFGVIIIVKYYFSNYKLLYKVNNHTVITIFKNNRLYYEIDSKYNFDIYKKRTLNRKVIDRIINISGEDFECIYPVIKNETTYPLCIKDNKQMDYHLIDSELLSKYKIELKESNNGNNNFMYYNNLPDNTYIALWNYKGFFVMNKKSYKNVELFKTDMYDNSLSYIINNIIYMPNYDEEHEFSSIIALDLLTNKKSTIKFDYKIDYDSYIVGNIGKNLYIFDNKYSVLYELNTKKKIIKIIGNNEIGYTKYINGSFVTCSKSEYKVNKIKYSDDKQSLYKYSYSLGLYKTINDNNKINTLINKNKVSIVNEYKNTLYFVDEDYLYMYSPSKGNEKVFYFFELNFNKDNTIFIYNN